MAGQEQPDTEVRELMKIRVWGRRRYNKDKQNAVLRGDPDRRRW